MSSMRSASSRTSIRKLLKWKSRRSRKSSRRPGVATTKRAPLPDGLKLRAFGKAADNQSCGLKLLAAQSVVLLQDLHGQLARRHEHQGVDAGSVLLQELLDHRDEEGQRFAGSGHGGSEHVFACSASGIEAPCTGVGVMNLAEASFSFM